MIHTVSLFSIEVDNFSLVVQPSDLLMKLTHLIFILVLQAFQDVPALITHHKSNDVILVNVSEHKQYKTKLKRNPVAINGM